MRWIFGDTETTGLGRDSKAVEIAWVETDDDFNVVAKHHSLLNPMMPIQPDATEVHGITNEMVADKPTIDQYMDFLGHPLQGDDVVLAAHNARFDRAYFGPWMGEVGVLCTLKAARAIYPDAPNHKLGTLKSYLSLTEDGKTHSASGDVHVLLQLAKRLCFDADTDLYGLLALTNKPRVIEKMPFGMHKGKRLIDVPQDYVHWLLSQANVDADLRKSLEAL